MLVRATILILGLSGLVDGCACSAPPMAGFLPAVQTSSASSSTSARSPGVAPSQDPPPSGPSLTERPSRIPERYRLPSGASGGKCTAGDMQPLDIRDPAHITLEEKVFGTRLGEISVSDSEPCP